jgi:hypothetical protein
MEKRKKKVHFFVSTPDMLRWIEGEFGMGRRVACGLEKEFYIYTR